MQQKQKKCENMLLKIIKYSFIIITCLIIFVISGLLGYGLYVKHQFIEDCVKEGRAHKYCQMLWNEIDELN